MVSVDSRGIFPHYPSGLTKINTPIIDLTMNNSKYLQDILHLYSYTISTQIQYKGTNTLQFIPTGTK
jgi:hypothetical protein